MLDDALRQFAMQTLAAQQAAAEHHEVNQAADTAKTLASLPSEDAKKIALTSLQTGGQGAATMSHMPTPGVEGATAGPPAASAAAPAPAAAPVAAVPGSEPTPQALPQAMPTQVTVNNNGVATDGSAATLQANADLDNKFEEQLKQDRGNVAELDRRAHEAGVQARADYDAGNARRQQGMQDEIAAREAQWQEQAPYMAGEIEMQRAQIAAQKKVDDWHVATEQRIMANSQQIHDKMTELAAHNPGDLWGNWNAGQKVAGIIGIIAAGLSHQDATARVHQMATDAINAQQRQMEGYEALGRDNENLLKQSEGLYTSKKAAIDNMYAGYYSVVAKQLKMAAARAANPIAAAQMEQAAGALDQDGAKFALSSHNIELTHQYKGMDQLVQLTAMQQQTAAHHQAAQAAADKQARVELEGKVAGRTGYMTPTQKQAFFKVESGGHALIEGIIKLRKMAEHMHKFAGVALSPAESEHQRAAYAAAREALMTAFKNYDNTGARIEESEKARFEHLLPTVNAVQSGLAWARSDEYGMMASQDMIVDIIRKTGDSLGGGTSKFDESFPLYRETLARDKNDLEAIDKAKQDADDMAAGLRDQQVTADSAANAKLTGGKTTDELLAEYAKTHA